MVESAQPVLLVIATGPRLYREYLLRSISARYRVFLISATEPDWALQYLEDAVIAPGGTASAVLSAARRLAARLPVAGVMTWAEDYVLHTATTAEELCLPGPTPAAVRRCRDKSRTRSALSARGVQQPASVPVGNLSQALAAAQRLR